MKYLLILTFVLTTITMKAQIYNDTPFIQDYADRYELDDNQKETIKILEVRSDRNQKIHVLSSEGILQPHEKKMVPEMLYRPLTDEHIISIETYKDQFVYLTDKAVMSNAWAGTFYIEHNIENARKFVIGNDFSTLVAGDKDVKLFVNGKEMFCKSISDLNPIDILYNKKADHFLVLTKDAIYRADKTSKMLKKVYAGSIDMSSFVYHHDEIILGTTDGIKVLTTEFETRKELNQKLPCNEITVIKNINGTIWYGSKRGVFKLRSESTTDRLNEKYDYYASKRWLVDDEVIDIAEGPENSVLILTKKGLSKINFVSMTLEEKAAHFQKIQRLRHIRYGFTSATRLQVPGDLSTSMLIDTDNDGLWTSMYMASELFRYKVTKSEDAKLNAYEAFEAMERLTKIPGLDGFPARTYERDKYVHSDASNGYSAEKHKEWEKENGKLWRLTKDGQWRWKSSTSSDESCGHFFVYALFAELAPDKEWRDRAIHQIKIEMDHIIENDWYLVTWNGKITPWGRWNPEYVNKFPITVGDRRLNSTLILSFLQTAYHFTHDEKYKKAAKELIEKHGYDINANRPASVIGFVAGEDLSDRWNHSDDEMYFLTIPAFVNYSFSEEQRKNHFDAAKSHWEIERNEKNPLWNYLFAISGGQNIDVEESAWWLREFPMDLLDWKVDNSQRQDLVKIAPNFRNQTYTEVLPQDERVLSLHNGAYRNDGGSDGYREYDPYIYLLPYWAGRYVGAISSPK